MAGEVAGIAAAVIGLLAVSFAAIEWRRRSGELRLQSQAWLYIPAPPRGQTPLEPVFWVYPPIWHADESCDLVVAGVMRNAGPGDAYSVRIFADPELSLKADPDRARAALLRTVEDTIAQATPSPDIDELYEKFVANYKNRSAYTPVLRRGEEERFVVVAHYARPTEYLRHISVTADSETGARVTSSQDWTQGNRQAHPVNALERDALGNVHSFGPGDLCAPFEEESDLERWGSTP